ncbi:cation:proton antiporter [Costertonia aggregata]|uniref:Cation:proton antiporter n=1 Tax=Costertonia aggregata TaxID=343403 RepID=A0A7H9AST2_9FLAO|nr:cation:proton antiporter [Costertonia aggregata]QLG46514.1 cation:proton antiporter [Costertonia aggregata]
MKKYVYILFAFGFAAALMAYLPILAKRLKISYTLPLLCIGMLFFYLGVPVDWPEPFWEHNWVKVITKIIVIISLMGAGLKIGMRYGFRHWRNPLRLIHTSMPLYILGIFLIAKFLLDFDGASALLLAAVCSPTDPVLAADLQLQEDELDSDKNTGMRYLLTAEAGLNDGLAFPFVFLAILWAKAGRFSEVDLAHWLGFYLLYKIMLGVLVGSLLGYLYSLSIKKINSFHYEKVLSGFVGIALAFFSFALVEVLNGYGFIAVFFTGLLAQYHNHKEKTSYEKQEILVFNEEIEKFLIVLWTLLFGGFLASGILKNMDVAAVLLPLFLILCLRPISGWLGLLGTTFTEKKKWAIGFFGIKGVGSFFYLAYALHETNFAKSREIYAMVSLMVLISIVVHGFFGPKAVAYFKKRNPG